VPDFSCKLVIAVKQKYKYSFLSLVMLFQIIKNGSLKENFIFVEYIHPHQMSEPYTKWYNGRHHLKISRNPSICVIDGMKLRYTVMYGYVSTK
jgi:hypothetical protein